MHCKRLHGIAFSAYCEALFCLLLADVHHQLGNYLKVGRGPCYEAPLFFQSLHVLTQSLITYFHLCICVFANFCICICLFAFVFLCTNQPEHCLSRTDCICILICVSILICIWICICNCICVNRIFWFCDPRCVGCCESVFVERP